jgi:hypothetical protein
VRDLIAKGMRTRFVYEVRWTEVDLKGKKVERVKEFSSTMEFLAKEDASRFASEKRAVGYTPVVTGTTKPWSPNAPTSASRALSPSIPPPPPSAPKKKESR